MDSIFASNWLHGRLIADWRRGWRFWSVRLEALAITCGTALLAAPDAILQLWAAIPPDARTLIPPQIGPWLPVLLGLAALAARFIKQGELRDD